MKICGSTVVAWASSKEEVLDILKADIYAKEGVWDLEKVSDVMEYVESKGIY